MARSPRSRAPADPRRRRPSRGSPSCKCSWRDGRCRRCAARSRATRRRSGHRGRAGSLCGRIAAAPGRRKSAVQLVHDRHADMPEMIGIADPGQLQDVRRADRTRREDHLARRLGPFDGPAAQRELDARRTLAVEQDAMHQRVSDGLEVRPLWRRPQIGARGVLARRRPPRVCPRAACPNLHTGAPGTRFVPGLFSK